MLILPKKSPFLSGCCRGLAVLALFLTGCAGDDSSGYKERPVEELYNGAMTAMENGDNVPAALMFDEVERQHPYSVWATKAQLMSAYAYYRQAKYDEAIIGLDRFIQLHPGHKDVAYAYYLKSLCYYEQISDVGRDQKMTDFALKTMEELVTRFPESSYSRDAKLKIDLTRDHLAGKEMEIGRYYLNRKQPLAAVNRFRNVVENYQTTSHVPEALHRLTESYLALGVTSEAQASAAVLGFNFPGSKWYEDSYQLLAGANLAPQRDEKSWLDRVFGKRS